MTPSIYLGKILGIEIRVHYTWFIAFLLVTSTLANQFSTTQNWPYSISILAAVLAALFLFSSIVFHEIAHSFIGIRNNTPIKSISLFLFGGVAQMTKEPPSPFAEFKMALAGPLFSLCVAILFWSLSRLPLGLYFPVIFSYLSLINLVLVVFNLFPAFPLDGGRVFRSMLWSFSKDFKRATFWASRLSRLFAFLIIFLGFIQIFSQNLIGGIWLIFMGWFLLQAAEMSFQQVLIKDALYKIKISEIMNREFKTTEPSRILDQLREDFFHYQQGGFPVVENDKIIGIITTGDFKKILKQDWDKKRVFEAMTPLSRLITIAPADSAFEALNKMTKHDIGRLPVVSEGKVLGLITRASLLFILSLIEGGEHDID